MLTSAATRLASSLPALLLAKKTGATGRHGPRRFRLHRVRLDEVR
jgi:hypothetical protein